MRKKMIRRICCTLLLICILASTVGATTMNPEATIGGGQVEVLNKDVSLNESTELSVLDGVYMYFHSTDDYTLSIAIYPTARVEIAKKDKNTDMLSQKVCTLNDIQTLNVQQLSPTNICSCFDEMEALTNLDEFPFDSQTNTAGDMLSDTSRTASSDADIAAKIDAELISIFGNTYTDKYLGNLTRSSCTAYLYETKSFERYHYTHWLLNAGTLITVIASWIDLPASQCLRIFNYVGSALSAYSIISDVTANKYVANVHNRKTVKVRSYYPYRAGRSEYGYCFIGDKAATYVSSNNVVKDFDFDDNTALMETGIDLFLNGAY